MVAVDIFTKHKNKLLNIGVIILAIFAASKIYSKQNMQLNSLNEQKAQEIKKNNVLESISQVEKRAVTYKQFFSKKELGEVVDILSNIAKDANGVQIISVKPAGGEDRSSGYIKTSFIVLIKVADYHALGAFVSKLENYKDLYLVEDVHITASNFESSSGNILEQQATVNLKISVVSYL